MMILKNDYNSSQYPNDVITKLAQDLCINKHAPTYEKCSFKISAQVWIYIILFYMFLCSLISQGLLPSSNDDFDEL